jgi:hypothetical protein
MRTTNASVSGVKVLVNESPVLYNTLSGIFSGKKVDISEVQKMLGDCGSDRLEKTTKTHKFKLNVELKTCKQCAID